MRQQITARKTLKKLLLFSIIVSSILFSCKKFDVTALKESDQNFTEKFFSTRNPPNKEVAGIIELLKLQNSKSEFVEKLPRTYGLPIWEKSGYVLNSNSNNSFTDGIVDGNDIYIPMAINANGLSAVIVAHQQSDTFDIKFYSKDYLYDICHSDSLNVSKAENLLVLFFAMENYCFGTTNFYHIPSKLFEKSKEKDSLGDKIIRIKDNSKSQSTNSLIHCVTFYHCINTSPC